MEVFGLHLQMLVQSYSKDVTELLQKYEEDM